MSDDPTLKQIDRDKLFALSVDMLVVANFSGTFDQVNPAWMRTFGWSEAELLKVTWRELVHPDDLRATREAGKRLFAGQAAVQFENRLQCKDGGWRWVSWNAFPVIAEQKIYAVVRDITAQKAAEAQQRELQDHQRQLTERLRESQKLEALGTLAAGIAHDFSNILATVLGNAALALDDLGPGHPAAARLQQINQAGHRAGELVRQVLAFGKNFAPELRPLALRGLVEQALERLSATLPAGVGLQLVLADEPFAALADAAQLHHVLDQLWRNAVQAFDGEPGRLELGLERWDRRTKLDAFADALPEGPYARLWLRDSGRGMDGATLQRIFEPFFTTRQAGRGSGLGLSAVHGIVSAHGGLVQVESLPGQGTTVHLLLPLTDKVSVQAAPERCTTEAGRTPRHVLYVDDDETVMTLMLALLERQGLRATGHRDPDAALDAVRAAPGGFDLVITDFNMPARNGLDLAADLVRIRADLPVVILSGYVSDRVRADAEKLGVRRVVSKGGSVDELNGLVRRLLDDLAS
ncbi:hybrid sensor histidine kinase/response regulator [Aquabacterium humicola]|uniref:hybrid sensor histidine kinase/response regulator n=1 Tax=Aquabacterium humicola TaxID=3237377 RepID=UPI002543FB56|nr:PAS domain S-box protein [Rubrivivax pictus]